MGYQLWTSPLTGYRRKGTRFTSFKQIFIDNVNAKCIYEPLLSCRANSVSGEVKEALQIRGFDVSNLLVEAGGIIQNVKSILEKKFGMVLSDTGVPLHKPIARFYTPEAKELNKYGTVVVEGIGSLDHSPPENLAHLEYRGLVNTKNYVLMPIRVARIEQKIDYIENNLERLTNSLEQVVGPLSKLVNLMELKAVDIEENKNFIVYC